MKTPGLYVPLDVNYVTDEGVRRAGPAAELLFIRGLAYSKRTQSDGFLPDYDMPVISVGLPQVRESIGQLVEWELWQAVDGGWQIRSWRRWNETNADATEKRRRAADRQKRSRERRSPAASNASGDADTEGDTVPVPLQIVDESQNTASRHAPVTRDNPVTSQPCHTPKRREEKRREENTTTSLPKPRRNRSTPTDDSDFDAFYAAYPKRKEKLAAAKAYRAAIKAGATPEQILTAATIYAGERFGQDPRFTKLPATWLNKGCWADEADTATNVVVLHTGFQHLAATGTDGYRPSTADRRVAEALALADELRREETQQ